MSAPQETISASQERGRGRELRHSTYKELCESVLLCVCECDLCICMTVHSYTVMQISVGVAPAATLYELSNNCKGRRQQQSGAVRPFFNSMLSAPLLLIFMLINLTT